MTSRKIKAVGYVRVSTEQQEISPEVQREVIARWAKTNNIELVATHADLGVSGSMPWAERPGLSAAVADVKRHGASWLVVAKIDRLSRDLFNQLHLGKHLETTGARFISCTEAPEEQTPEKTLMQNVVGAFSEYERAMIRTRIKAALQLRKAQGVRLGAPPIEATEYGRCVVWMMWHLRDQGLGPERIARHMNEQNILGPRGGQIHPRNVERILKRERPTAIPRGWRGPKDTWKGFEVGSRALRRDRFDTDTPGGPQKSGRAAARAARAGDVAYGFSLKEVD